MSVAAALPGLVLAAANPPPQEGTGQPIVLSLAIFALAAFVGFFVISRVPNTLHTPLMSATNAIHGIVLLGAVIAIGAVGNGFSLFLAIVAIVFGTINIVGGFLVTDRMLLMFRSRRGQEREQGQQQAQQDRNVIRVGEDEA